MKSHRALSPAAPVRMALVALAAQIGGLFLQKILERFDPGQQTEVLKAALNLLEFTPSRSSVTEPSAITEVVSCIVFVTGVAPLRGFSTPSLPAQGSSAQIRSATSSGTFPLALAGQQQAGAITAQWIDPVGVTDLFGKSAYVSWNRTSFPTSGETDKGLIMPFY